MKPDSHLLKAMHCAYANAAGLSACPKICEHFEGQSLPQCMPHTPVCIAVERACQISSSLTLNSSAVTDKHAFTYCCARPAATAMAGGGGEGQEQAPGFGACDQDRSEGGAQGACAHAEVEREVFCNRTSVTCASAASSCAKSPLSQAASIDICMEMLLSRQPHMTGAVLKARQKGIACSTATHTHLTYTHTHTPIHTRVCA